MTAAEFLYAKAQIRQMGLFIEEQLLDHVLQVTISSVTGLIEQRLSDRAASILEHQLTKGASSPDDIKRAREELAGSPIGSGDGLPDALIKQLGALSAGKVLELLYQHGWGPRQSIGRRRSAKTTLGYCSRHGAGVELRLYSSGKLLPTGERKKVWRCWLCMSKQPYPESSVSQE